MPRLVLGIGLLPIPDCLSPHTILKIIARDEVVESIKRTIFPIQVQTNISTGTGSKLPALRLRNAKGKAVANSAGSQLPTLRLRSVQAPNY